MEAFVVLTAKGYIHDCIYIYMIVYIYIHDCIYMIVFRDIQNDLDFSESR